MARGSPSSTRTVVSPAMPAVIPAAAAVRSPRLSRATPGRAGVAGRTRGTRRRAATTSTLASERPGHRRRQAADADHGARRPGGAPPWRRPRRCGAVATRSGTPSRWAATAARAPARRSAVATTTAGADAIERPAGGDGERGGAAGLDDLHGRRPPAEAPLVSRAGGRAGVAVAAAVVAWRRRGRRRRSWRETEPPSARAARAWRWDWSRGPPWSRCSRPRRSPPRACPPGRVTTMGEPD